MDQLVIQSRWKWGVHLDRSDKQSELQKVFLMNRYSNDDDIDVIPIRQNPFIEG